MRGFSTGSVFFSSKETGLVDYLSTNGLSPLGLFGRGFEWSKEMGLAHFGFL